VLTRRRFLELGAAAWLGTMLGGVRTARAAGVDVTAPAYLRRASWTPLAGTAVAVAGVTLRLADIGDLPHLAGRDDAFRLELTGAAGALAGGIHSFRHPALGSFSLFVAPVDTVVDGVQRYEVVVDRSVGVPHSVPQAPAATAPAASAAAPAASAPPAAAGAPTAPHRARRRRKRRRHKHVLARRLRRVRKRHRVHAKIAS
jgi:hypothetical protein